MSQHVHGRSATKRVKLFGGPLNGETIMVPKSAERVTIGKPIPFFVYTYAGKEGRQELFAIQPKSRRARKFIFWYVGKHGKDPRVESVYMQPQPMRNPNRVAHGRGAAKRRAKRGPESS